MKDERIIWLLAGAAMCALTAPAQAQTAADTESIARLRAEIAALQARLDAVEARIAASASPAPAAPANPASAAPASPAPAAPAAVSTGSTRIGGRIYWNLSHIRQKSDGADTSQTGTQTELKRFYVTLDHRFDDRLSANLTTDFRYNSGGSDKDVLLYVKKAYVQVKLAPELVVRVGSADMPWVPFVEAIYGYRFVENVLVDRVKYGTSADWGVHLSGAFGDGIVRYAASAVNGAGYRTLARNSGTIDLEGRLSVQPVGNLILGVGGYSGKLGKGSAVSPATHRATRVNALIGYTGKRLRGGVEVFTATNWNNVTTIATDKTSGWSAFGSVAVAPGLALFGRYDKLTPDKRSNPALDDAYFNVGAGYQPMKNVDLALVYKREQVDNGFVRTSNGTIGGADTGSYDEVGLWTQFRF